MMQSHQFKINHTLIAVADGDGGNGEAVNNVKKTFHQLVYDAKHVCVP